MQALTAQLNRIQGENLGLVCQLTLVLLFIFYGRNYVRFGSELPLWHTMTAAIVILSTVAITLIVSFKWLPLRLAQLVGATLMLLHGAATLSNILADLGAGVYASSMTVIGMSVGVLSVKYFTVTVVFYLIVWLIGISAVQEAREWIPTAGLVALSTLVACSIQYYRLKFAIDLLMLENRVEELEAYLSICANCKNVRDTNDQWIPLEEFMESSSGKKVSHGICPECKKQFIRDYETSKATRRR